MMVMHISKTLRLEETSGEHASDLFRAIDENRDHLSPFLPWVPAMKSEQNIKEYIKGCVSLAEQGKEVSFVIFDRSTLVGRIGIHQIHSENKAAAIGYWLTRAAQGNGIITSCCKTLIEYAFTRLGLHRIEIRAAVENAKSRAIPEKLNFTQEGILRQAERVGDRFLDIVVYSLLRSEWNLTKY